MRAIAKDPLGRYQRAGELSAELKDFLSSFLPGTAKSPARQQAQA